MFIQTATPYLILNGKAERAIALYQSVLGAQTETLRRFGDVDGSCAPAQKDRVMHAELRVGGARIMLSDGAGGDAPAGPSHVSIALELSDPAEARRSFEALGATGKVVQPLFDSPWGTLFGVVIDELGVQWMFDCAKQSAS
jgi:PhnB protein